jgi:hypothetical protein
MLILYMGLIRSVLEYDCIAFDRMTGYAHVEVGKDVMHSSRHRYLPHTIYNYK